MIRIIALSTMMVLSAPMAFAMGADDTLMSKIVQFAPLNNDSQKITRMHCVGTLLSEDWVITAAHCFEDKADIIALRCTNDLAAQSLETQSVQALVRHSTHDIALFRIPAMPHCHPRSSNARQMKDTERLTLGDNRTPELFTLHQSSAEHPVRNYLRVLQANAKTYLADDQQCLTQGDSGTPVFAINANNETALAAILISGTSDCPALQILANVSDFKLWIESKINAERY